MAIEVPESHLPKASAIFKCKHFTANGDAIYIEPDIFKFFDPDDTVSCSIPSLEPNTVYQLHIVAHSDRLYQHSFFVTNETEQLFTPQTISNVPNAIDTPMVVNFKTGPSGSINLIFNCSYYIGECQLNFKMALLYKLDVKRSAPPPPTPSTLTLTARTSQSSTPSVFRHVPGASVFMDVKRRPPTIIKPVETRKTRRRAPPTSSKPVYLTPSTSSKPVYLTPTSNVPRHTIIKHPTISQTARRSVRKYTSKPATKSTMTKLFSISSLSEPLLKTIIQSFKVGHPVKYTNPDDSSIWELNNINFDSTTSLISPHNPLDYPSLELDPVEGIDAINFIPPRFHSVYQRYINGLPGTMPSESDITKAILNTPSLLMAYHCGVGMWETSLAIFNSDRTELALYVVPKSTSRRTRQKIILHNDATPLTSSTS